MVAEHGEKVVGFMIYELHKNKLHILNFAVHPAWRRMAVGAQMVAKLISKLSSHRRTRITLEVRVRTWRRSCSSARDRKSTRLNSSHTVNSYAVFCLKKKKKTNKDHNKKKKKKKKTQKSKERE